jgi:hypothetical protein
MKILTVLIAGGALMLGTAFAQDAPKTTTPAAQTPAKAKVKKHHKHKKTATPAAATHAAPVTPANAAPTK